MTEVHVVFGAGGGLGSAIVRYLASRGEFVRAVVRDPEEARRVLPDTAGIVTGDAFDPASTASACRGADIVYDCVNIRYSRWSKELSLVRSNVLAAASKASARLVVPDGVNVYGPLQTAKASENHPRDAATRKGALAAEIERMLLDSARSGKAKVVIPRFPDLYGPYVVNPFMLPKFQAALSGKTATWPVNLDAPHDLLFAEDAAAATVRLAQDPAAFGEVWHVPGPGPLTGRQFLEMMFAAAGAKPRVRTVGRGMFKLFGAFIPDAGEMVELLYQYERPFVLDGGKFAARFPDFAYTPHREAMTRTVAWFREMLA
ncbi:MAG TPA: NAD-dependent epimerase/dehydratase family protein [Chloroflexota bacterium]